MADPIPYMPIDTTRRKHPRRHNSGFILSAYAFEQFAGTIAANRQFTVEQIREASRALIEDDTLWALFQELRAQDEYRDRIREQVQRQIRQARSTNLKPSTKRKVK